MRIVIDLQACQTLSGRRGVGRYSLGLARSMARHAGEHEFWLALNGLFSETLIPIREAFAGLIPPERIRVWQAQGPVAALDPANSWRRRAGEILRSHALAELRPDIVYVSHLFEGLGDDALTCAAPTTGGLSTAVTLYDLIPLVHEHIYLENPQTRAWYYRNLQSLKNAEIILAISEASRQESIGLLQLPPERVVNISAAVDDWFRPSNYSSDAVAALRKRYTLARPFVMYTGGIDHRKNIDALVKAYSVLPARLRAGHHLAIVCSIQDGERNRLQQLGRKAGLAPDELVLTGYVPDDDLVMLYNCCKLFVFPSWHEGFGLPVLEAMSCGAPVIVANTSSLPEVVGSEDALFDPHSQQAITAKLHQALTDECFRTRLCEHGVKRAREFSWDASARRTLAALENWYERQDHGSVFPAGGIRCQRKPRLAYISPLPPERSGIADYSAELLPELARYYDVELVVNQPTVDDPWLTANFPVRDWHWFDAHAARYERVLYHFGNSHFHKHMFELLSRRPGVVVLHDFCLSGILASLELIGEVHGAWSRALYESHGYPALLERTNTAMPEDLSWKYPANIAVLNQADGVIVHARYSILLARQWYGADIAGDWAYIPLLRKIPAAVDRRAARERLGLREDDFLVCSFGFLAPTKLNHRILEGWLYSSLADDKRCHMVFVGENHGGPYGADLLRTMAGSKARDRIRITGFVDPELYKTYLAAADAAVQLRSVSRGESTSAGVLDCMVYAVPTIVNAHGTMAELPDDAVLKLPAEFADDDLVTAFDKIKSDPLVRRRLGAQAAEHMRVHRAPAHIGRQYRDAIERFAESGYFSRRRRTIATLAAVDASVPASHADLVGTAAALAASSQPIPQRQLLVDVSELDRRDGESCTRRAARAMVRDLLQRSPDGYRVEPVTITEDGMRYAHQFTCGLLGLPAVVDDETVEARSGDVLLGLYLRLDSVATQQSMFAHLRGRGVGVYFCVYDLLPVLRPDFPADAEQKFYRWLKDMCTIGDGAICISHEVADELFKWLEEQKPERQGPFKVGYLLSGADMEESLSNPEGSTAPEHVLAAIGDYPAFLMVGTVEPQKGYAQVLAAFESLWAQGRDYCLVIVGTQGQVVDSLVGRFRTHPEKGRRLFWLEGANDQVLDGLYRNCSALLMTSENECFDPPLIEAARRGLPIIVRDLPVFREIADEHAFYFSGTDAKDISDAICEWLILSGNGGQPRSGGMVGMTWRESAQRLQEAICEDKWYKRWLPPIA